METIAASDAAPVAILDFDVVDRLAKSLRHSGIGVGEMARYLGVNRNTVGRYLSGRTRVDLRTLRSWAEATGYPLGWLQTGDGPSPDPATPSVVRPAGIEPATNGLNGRRRSMRVLLLDRREVRCAA